MKVVELASEIIVEVPKLNPIPALPDKSKDGEAWQAIQSILNPSEIKVDEDLLCPITCQLLKDPVLTADGQMYERKAIEQWLTTHNTSPRTNLPLEHKKLVKNYFAKTKIEEFLKKNPGLEDSAEDISEDLISALSTACIKGDQKQIQKLVAQDRRLLVHSFEIFKGQTALHFAVSDPQALDTVVELLEKRCTGLGLAGLLKADSEGFLPIHTSVGWQNTQVLLKLSMWMGTKLALVPVPPKWPKNFDNRVLDEVLAWSISRSDSEKTRCFLRLGANPQTRMRADKRIKCDKTPLVYQAVKNGNYDCLVALLEAKADPNVVIPGIDDTLLHYAVSDGADDISTALVRAGTRLDTQLKKNGWTPLHLAARNFPRLFNALFNGKQGLPENILEISDYQGYTPLHHAADLNRENAVEWLLKHKANPLAADQCGETALHISAKNGAILIMKMLLRAGVPPEMKNKEGLCARKLAEKHEKWEFIEEYDRIIKEMQVEEEKASKKSLGKDLILKQHEIINEQKAQLKEQEREIEKLRTLLEEQNQKLHALSSGIKSPISMSLSLGLDDKKLESGRPYSFFQKVPPFIVQLAERTKIDLVYLFTCYNEGKPTEDYRRINWLSSYLCNYVVGKKPSFSKEEVLELSIQESVNLWRCYDLIADGIMTISQAKPLTDQESSNLEGNGLIGARLVREKILPLDTVIHLSEPEMREIEENHIIKKLSLKDSVTAALKKYHSAALTK